MKKFKLLTSLAITTALSGFVPVIAGCSCKSETIYPLIFTPIDSKSCSVSAKPWDTTTKNVVIPSQVKILGETYNVTEIGAYAFWGDLSLETITIPDSVTKINKHAFYGCDNLKEVKFTSNNKMWMASKSEKNLYKSIANPIVCAYNFSNMYADYEWTKTETDNGKINSFKINKTSLELVGRNQTNKDLNVEIQGEGEYDHQVVWLSSDDSSVKVSQQGSVHSRNLPKDGKVTITAYAAGDVSKHATCEVTVNHVDSTTIDLNHNPSKLSLDDKNLVLYANMGSGTSDVVWTSSNEDIAKVDSTTGKVTPIKEGEVTFTGKIKDTEKTATHKLNVVKPSDESIFSFIMYNDSCVLDHILYVENQVENIVIPATYKGKPVISVEWGLVNWSTANNSKVKTVVFPNSLKKINGTTFEKCFEIQNVSFPNSAEFIDGWQFGQIKTQTQFYMPPYVNYIGAQVFGNHGSTINQVYFVDSEWKLTNYSGTSIDNYKPNDESKSSDNAKYLKWVQGENTAYTWERY